MSPTPAYRTAIDRLLRAQGYETLHRFLADRRAKGTAYEHIARELSQRTDVPIVAATVRRWTIALNLDEGDAA